VEVAGGTVAFFGLIDPVTAVVLAKDDDCTDGAFFSYLTDNNSQDRHRLPRKCSGKTFIRWHWFALSTLQ
jgi:hypothetical protein